jgi:hypothetical protein
MHDGTALQIKADQRGSCAAPHSGHGGLASGRRGPGCAPQPHATGVGPAPRRQLARPQLGEEALVGVDVHAAPARAGGTALPQGTGRALRRGAMHHPTGDKGHLDGVGGGSAAGHASSPAQRPSWGSGPRYARATPCSRWSAPPLLLFHLPLLTPALYCTRVWREIGRAHGLGQEELAAHDRRARMPHTSALPYAFLVSTDELRGRVVRQG